jgi:zinc/manganese transport system permease protein
VIGVAATWLGVLLAYDSYYWPPARQGWPVSFFVVALVLAGYLLAQFAVTRPAGSRRDKATRQEKTSARLNDAGA